MSVGGKEERREVQVDGGRNGGRRERQAWWGGWKERGGKEGRYECVFLCVSVYGCVWLLVCPCGYVGGVGMLVCVYV